MTTLVDPRTLGPGQRFRTEDAVGDGDGAAFARVAHARNSCKAFDAGRPVEEDKLHRVMELTLVWRGCSG